MYVRTRCVSKFNRVSSHGVRRYKVPISQVSLETYVRD